MATLLVAACHCAQAQTNTDQAHAANNDLANRSADIHWPAGFSPEQADLFAHNEIFINAPRATVWKHLVEATKWPEWYQNSQNVQITNNKSGALTAGSEFKWETFGLGFVSHVHEYVTGSRIGWFGNGNGFHGYHTWLLTDSAGGCKVVTEEVVKGPRGIAMRKQDPNGMHKGHDQWDLGLKAVSEGKK